MDAFLVEVELRAEQIRFPMSCVNEKQNSDLFFQCHVKTKNENQIRFSMSHVNKKWKWNLNSIFLCHRKTVGTKVHAF